MGNQASVGWNIFPPWPLGNGTLEVGTFAIELRILGWDGGDSGGLKPFGTSHPRKNEDLGVSH